jgi:histidinol-phosphate aminotransferase
MGYENLIVLRTFSKWAGIAGLRLGYGIFPDWLMPTLWKAKQPYNVNVAATAAGLASLAHRDEIRKTVDALIAERERLYRELAKIPFLQPYPSRANFVLCRVLGRDAKELKAALAAQGILVRYYARPGLENCIRVSAGRPQETEALLDTLSRMVA